MSLRHIVAGAAVVVASCAVGATFAATGTDPRDAGEKLDLKVVRGSIEHGRVRIEVGTYGAVKPIDLGGSLSNLVVLLDSNHDGRVDYRAMIVSRKPGKLIAELSGHGKQFEPLPVKRRGATLSTTFPADVVTRPGKTLRVAATSRYQACACQGKHLDRAPNAGWVGVR